jgi:hypothetical protein
MCYSSIVKPDKVRSLRLGSWPQSGLRLAYIEYSSSFSYVVTQLYVGRLEWSSTRSRAS